MTLAGRFTGLLNRFRAGPARVAPAAPVPLDHYPGPPACHPTSWAFPGYLNNPGSPWLQSLRELYAMPIAFPSSIAPEVGLLVHGLVRNIQPRTAIEIGAFVGVSTHWIASALFESTGDPYYAAGPGHLHVFDLFGPIHKGPWCDAEMLSGRLEWISGRLDRAGLSALVTLHPGDSAAAILAMREQLNHAGGVQFAFIDGDHTPGGVLRDFRAVEPVLNTGGYVLLHDTDPAQSTHTGPRHLIDRLDSVAEGTYETCELWCAPLNYGLALLRRTR